MPTSSLIRQRNASISSLDDLYLQDQYLLTLGIPSEITADNLLGYAYMQKGVEKATIEFNSGSEDGKVAPSVTYSVQFNSKFKRRYSSMAEARVRGGIWGKIKMLILSRLGTPMPGAVETAIARLAAGYLPPNYKVVINVI